MSQKLLTGFSKKNRNEKIQIITDFLSIKRYDIENTLMDFLHRNPEIQAVLDEISENAVSNYYLPFSVAPNFLINNRFYVIPMVIEESSVVAAAASAAKFWAERGGFKTRVLSTIKPGHVYIYWPGNFSAQKKWFDAQITTLLQELSPITQKMEKRGGGIQKIHLINEFGEPNIRKIEVLFETADAMGANFINTCLEKIAEVFQLLAKNSDQLHGEEKHPKIIMAILSNYTPECIVECKVECNIHELKKISHDLTPEEFSWKFEQAVTIAKNDISRATTHNKGIFNGIDAVVLATGNDFRAVEAAGHAYAARSGRYSSLTDISIANNTFKYELVLPMALGTVGGLTTLHPIAKLSMKILGEPNAKQLMQIVAATGLANNFSAINSLITKGIQSGHMKMHLNNILSQLGANSEEKKKADVYFSDKTITFNLVEDFLRSIRKQWNH